VASWSSVMPSSMTEGCGGITAGKRTPENPRAPQIANCQPVHSGKAQLGAC
jgi:hypothetical protein